ncbi:Activating signal cointegrator 1 complex subunit 1 [Rhynchospora pubera]|uniref:Activating signal cointegrator 1 complex subunit 1 n=1 Tax=Rhynchospora pubera TaxID=906938 RepID=A0AAV8FUJ6_9POAL|nr:Activating signal cointegrator 1 complex subunit 1 [Rhynchospora pubera]
MIASTCRAFFTSRIDRLPRLLSVSYVPSYAVRTFQGTISQANLRSLTTMNVGKGGSHQTAQKKKQRAFNQVWKPISTEAAASEEKLEVDGSVSLQPSRADISKEELVSESSVTDEKCSITMQVDTPLLRFVKGKGGSIQKQIEEELKVRIIFPSSKEENSLVIEGNKVENMTKASERIKQVLEEAVNSRMLDYSHFISLPLALHPDLLKKLIKFQSTILGEIAVDDSGGTDHSGDELKRQSVSQMEVVEEKDQVRVKIAERGAASGSKSRILSDLGIDKSIFIKPKTFHLTVLMLKLWNKDRVATASDVLQRISSKVMDALENRPISIQLKGLTCMKGSPAKARVVYAPVYEVGDEGRLVRACEVIRDAFVESGLVVGNDAQQSLKLHATLMNVRHRKNKKKRWNDSFDARQIFDEYESEEWGKYPIQEIHLSQRFKFDESGYYHCCSSIALPHPTLTI